MADKTDRDNVIILRGQVAMLQAQIEAMARNVSETRQLYNQAQSELKALKARTMTDRDAADGYFIDDAAYESGAQWVRELRAAG